MSTKRGLELRPLVRLGLAICLTAAGAAAQAGWTCTVLDPPSATAQPRDAAALGSDGSHQVGEVGPYASLWSGTAGSWTNLNPPGALQGIAYGIVGSQVAGVVVMPGFAAGQACLWNVVTGSCTNLHPNVPCLGSVATAISANHQAGYIWLSSGDTFAALWTGSADSFVNLNPAGAARSMINGMRDDQEAGYAMFLVNRTMYFHAGLWTGTAASWIDLHPTSCIHSYANGVSGGQQVGYVMVASGDYHASLWSGTAASWIDLNPPGRPGSEANAVYKGHQVGDFTASGNRRHACIWAGTAESCVDLSVFAPPNLEDTWAQGIWTDGTTTYVVGMGYGSRGYTALLWTHT